ncbi:MAG TPA: indole-3-glycerol-phosphate synthase [Candidatus Bathyarchaeia archaeon]|nr:indole-3-glycerol-phosphate synthase [Candidatus Bathyarchaeia archaeon]
MPDFLDKLAGDAKETVDSGYYEVAIQIVMARNSLKKAILKSARAPLITEIKAVSPSKGTIRTGFEAGQIAQAMERGGAVGISILTEPKHFKGSLGSLVETRRAVQLPVLMKDIIISSKQLEAASKAGASAVLLIQALFDRGYCECTIEEMITKAHSENLEVLLETHSLEEFRFAVQSDADLVGINNRNLGTLKVDLNVTKNIIANGETNGKIVVSESGVESPRDIRFLRECGANAFLVGSAIMLADDVEGKVRELVTAI